VEHRQHRTFITQHVAHVLPDFQYPDEYCYELINHTYRLQYLKDTVLYGQLSDPAATPISQCLLSNYQTLFCCLLKDDQFIKNVLNSIREGATSKDKQAEHNVKFYIDFIVELVSRVRPMITMRTEFLRKFEDTGLYEVLTLALSPVEVTPTSRYALWLAIVELFTGFIGRVPVIDPLDGFRTYICNWLQSRPFANGQETNLLERLTYGFTVDEELNRGLVIQLYHLLTNLLKCFDSPLEIHQDDVMYAEVMDYFLKDLGPLVLGVINRKWHQGSPQTEKTLVHQQKFCIELFISLVNHQEFHMREFIQSAPVIESIAGLIKSPPLEANAPQEGDTGTPSSKRKNRYPSLTITAIRFLKVCVLKTNDPFFTKCITSRNLMKPIIECFIANQPKDNLMSSTCRSLLEAIIMNNIETIVASIALGEYDKREDLDTLTRDIFEKMKKLHETNQTRQSLADQESLPEVPISTHLGTLPAPSLPVNSAWQKCESEEERFFSEDEKENNIAPQALTPPREFQPPKRNTEPENELDLLAHRVAKDPRDKSGQSTPKQTSTLTPPSSDSPSNSTEAKKKGIISFTFKTKRKRAYTVVDGTKKKKPRGSGDPSSEYFLSGVC